MIAIDMLGKMSLLGIVIIIGGIASLAFGYAANRRDKALQKWPSALGFVISSKIAQTSQARLQSPAHNRLPRSKPDYRQVNVWAIEAEYRFAVLGREYLGFRATSNPIVDEVRDKAAGPGMTLRVLRAKIPEGMQVPVYYNPDDPKESYLLFVESPRKKSLFRIGISLVLAGSAIVFVSRILGGQSN
jgi:hypothetical protein